MAMKHAATAARRRRSLSWLPPLCAGLLVGNGACRSFLFCEDDAQCAGAAGMSSPAAGGGGAGSGGRSTGGASGNATGGNAGVGGGAGGSGAGGVDKGTPARGDGGAGGNAGEPTHTRGGAGDSSAGGSSEASAGAAGAAGAAGDGPVCEASLEDCDGSTFTPCETDTRSSPLHCGGCARRCSGACHAGSCLEPSTLIEEISLIERGLAHVGQDWYALNANTLCTFKEGQPTARVIQSGLSNMSALEPGPDRLYLGDSTHWWSVSYANPGVLVDEQLEALDVKYMDGGLYWVDRARAVHFKGAASGSGVAYCVLPEAAFEVDSAVLARVGPGAPAVFRRGFGESIYSDVVACPAPDQASLGAPVSGTLIAQGDTSTDAGADAEKFYWNEGNTLFRADASGAKEELFRVPSDESSSRPFVIAGSSLILSFKQDFTAGLFVISLDSSSAPQVIGTFHQPRSLYVDEPSARLCYAEEDSSRVTCFALSELTARP